MYKTIFFHHIFEMMSLSTSFRVTNYFIVFEQSIRSGRRRNRNECLFSFSVNCSKGITTRKQNEQEGKHQNGPKRYRDLQVHLSSDEGLSHPTHRQQNPLFGFLQGQSCACICPPHLLLPNPPMKASTV